VKLLHLIGWTTWILWRCMDLRTWKLANSHCMLDFQGYKHKYRICNTHFFSPTTMFTRTRLSVTSYVHRLSCFNVVLRYYLFSFEKKCKKNLLRLPSCKLDEGHRATVSSVLFFNLFWQHCPRLLLPWSRKADVLFWTGWKESINKVVYHKPSPPLLANVAFIKR